MVTTIGDLQVCVKRTAATCPLASGIKRDGDGSSKINVRNPRLMQATETRTMARPRWWRHLIIAGWLFGMVSFFGCIASSPSMSSPSGLPSSGGSAGKAATGNGDNGY